MKNLLRSFFILILLLTISLLNGQNAATVEVENCIKRVANEELEGYEAIEALQKCLEASLNTLGEQDSTTALVLHKLGVHHYNDFYDLDNYFKAIEYYQRSLQIRRQTLPLNHLAIARSYFNLAVVYQELNDYRTAADFLQKSKEVWLQHQDLKNHVRLYRELGRLYRNLEDYNNAIKHYQLAINKLEQIEEPSYYEMGGIYQDMGLAMNAQEQETALYQAIEYFEKAIVFYKKTPEAGQDDIIGAQIGLANAFRQLKNYEQAQQLYEAGVAFFRNEKDSSNLTLTLNNLGMTHRRKGNLNQAEQVLQEGLNISLKLERFVATASIHENLGDVDSDKGNLELALSHYQQAIEQLIPSFKNKEVQANPVFANKNLSIYSYSGLFTHLNSKAKCLQQIHTLESLEIAAATYYTLDTLLHIIKTNLSAQTSRLFWQQEAFGVYENAINVLWQLYERSEEKRYLEELFIFSEKAKASLILAATTDLHAQFLAISDSLIHLGKNLKLKAGFFENTVALAEQRQTNSQPWLDSLVYYRAAYNDFIDELETHYPNYYQLKHKVETATVSSIQKQILDPNTALIEYFTSEDYIYVFSISQQDFQTHRLPKPANFEQQLRSFRQTLSNADDYQLYAQSAYAIYDSYLRPILEKLPASIQQLIIVPDDEFNTIPFEALLVQPSSTTSVRYQGLDYLLHQYQITYSYSATLLLHHQHWTAQSEQGLLGFAPNFEDLLYNESTLLEIKKIVHGLIFTGEEATKERLVGWKSNVNILHLSTHAQMDDREPLNSSIFLADSLTLTTAEIYNLPFQSQLAVLSACETGVGQSLKGEGVMSLARAFMYSGCPSVVTSLWRVDDEQTSQLMRYFYTFLKEGFSKDQALHQAKIKYLEQRQSDGLYHPFYWSSFVHIGERTGIDFGEWWEQGWVWLIMFGLLFGLFTLTMVRLRKDGVFKKNNEW